MSEPVEDFIDEIQAELCRLMACSNVKIDKGECRALTQRHSCAVYYTVGAVNRMGHKAMPSVSWIETGGKTDPIGSSEDGKIFTDVVRLRVLLQADDRESCRKLFMNLRNASMRVCRTQIAWGASTAPLEEKPNVLEALFAIEADVDLSLSVPESPQRLNGFPNPLPDYVLRPVVSATDQTLEHLE